MGSPLIVTAVLLLLPLAPATAIYWVLTPKSAREAPAGQTAGGEVKTGDPASGTSGTFKFNVVGSAAVYFTTLIFGAVIHHFAEVASVQEKDAEARAAQIADDASLKEKERIRASMTEQQAWFVELPVGIEDGSPPGENILVEIRPSFDIVSNVVRFWVRPDRGKFPSVTVSLPKVSGRTIDLNDGARFQYDNDRQQITGIGKVWLTRDKPYDANNGVALTAVTPAAILPPDPH